MPLPLLAVLGLGGAAFLGLGAHVTANDTNLCAKNIVRMAQEKYEAEYARLEKKNASMQESLRKLGMSKETAIKKTLPDFMKAYQEFKNSKLGESKYDLNVPSVTAANLALPSTDELETWQAALGSAAVGTASAVAVSLAASGMAPIALSLASVGGTALTIGEVGLAASAFGGAASTALSFTPFGVIAAPVALISGIAADMQADANMEKAQAAEAKVDAEVEKIKTQVVWCNAVIRRADELNKTLKLSMELLASCTKEMENILACMPQAKSAEERTQLLTKHERDVIGVGRALAAAVKQIVVVALLEENKKDLTKKSAEICTDVKKSLPQYTALLQENNAVD